MGKPVNLIWREMCTVLSPDESGPPDIPDLDALMEFIYTLLFPDETKWRILDLCKHYTDYLDELLALLRPAVLLVGKKTVHVYDHSFPLRSKAPKEMKHR